MVAPPEVPRNAEGGAKAKAAPRKVSQGSLARPKDIMKAEGP